MRGLPRRISSSNEWPRLAQPKAKLPKKPLTLTHAKGDVVLALNEFGQSLAVPQISRKSGGIRRLSERHADLCQLLWLKPRRPPRALSFRKPCESIFFKLPDPVLNRPGSIAKKSRRFDTTGALGDEQDSVEPVIITSFF